MASSEEHKHNKYVLAKVRSPWTKDSNNEQTSAVFNEWLHRQHESLGVERYD